MKDISYHEYWGEIAELARDITARANKYNEYLVDVLHETIDSHQWVIYTAYHADVLKHTQNDNAIFDEFGGITETEDVGRLLAQIVYCALVADVQEHEEYGLNYWEDNHE